MSEFFNVISRLRWIQRWSLKRNTVTENVMEHSWEVAAIAHMLGCINNQVFAGTVNADRLCTLALYHDGAEAITGDLPAPVKYYSPEIQKAYKAIEKDAEKSLVAMLPKALREQLAGVLIADSIPSDEKKFVKAADDLSAYIKACAELDNGNQEYTHTRDHLMERLVGYEMPEVDYFISNFLQSGGPGTDKVDDECAKSTKDKQALRRLRLA